jgi:hypothetical protein
MLNKKCFVPTIGGSRRHSAIMKQMRTRFASCQRHSQNFYLSPSSSTRLKFSRNHEKQRRSQTNYENRLPAMLTDDRGIEIDECRLALKTSLYSLARDRVDMYSNLVM